MTGRPGFNLFLDLDLENVKSGTLIRLVSLEFFYQGIHLESFKL